MRQRFTYRGDSLWWFTELYLHKMRRIDTAISTILALEAIAAEHQPVRLSVETTDATIQAAARAFSQASAVPVDVAGTVASRRKLGWPSFAFGFNARLSRLRSRAPSTGGRRSRLSSTRPSGNPRRVPMTARRRKVTSVRCSTRWRRRDGRATCSASVSDRAVTSAHGAGGIRWPRRADRRG
jgi:hypothetical protein